MPTALNFRNIDLPIAAEQESEGKIFVGALR
jgi:hypothetical protein